MTPEYALLDAAARSLGCAVRADEPMDRHTTFRIGGLADRWITADTFEQLSGLLPVLLEAEIPWLVLGNGSDLLVSDRGIRGCVLALGTGFKRLALSADGAFLEAGAGAPLTAACTFARDCGRTGLEFAYGIPGTLGGAVYMNAGAYGGEMKDVLETVTHLTAGGRLETVSGPELDLGYRHSRYTGGKDVILGARLRLAPGSPAAIAARMDDLLARRKAKQPYDQPSAGSVFKRPQAGYAARLIEDCGLKGRRVGGAQVSPKHAGFIVNLGGATCADVLALIEIVRQEVLRQTGVLLECEIIPVGEA